MKAVEVKLTFIFLIICSMLQSQECDSIAVNLNDSGDTILFGYYNNAKTKCGLWKHYHDNGALSSIGEYEEGKMVGAWLRYYPTGELKSKSHYIKLRPLTRDSIFKLGQYVGFYTSESDSEIGQSVEFYQNGKIKEISNFDSNGVPINQVLYNQHGHIMHYKIFKHDESCWYYYENNKLIKTLCIDDYIHKSPVCEVFYEGSQKTRMIEYKRSGMIITNFITE